MRLLSLSQLFSLLKKPPGHHFDLIRGYSVDSRKVQPNDLFFALKGEKSDGHAYIKEVREKKALAAVVSHDYPSLQEEEGFPLIRVADPLQTLQQLARDLLQQGGCQVIAITGSLGKTSIKEFIKTLLAVKYSVAATPGNSNSQIGLPLSILNHTSGKEAFFVAEMGMTTAGHIAQLVQIAPPQLAVLSTVALVHACNFSSLEGIAQAKSEIFSHPMTQIGIMPREVAHFDSIFSTGSCSKKTFGLGGEGQASDYELKERTGGFFLYDHLKQASHSFPSLPFPGRHNAHNFLAAAVAAHHCGLSWESIAESVHLLQLPEKRLQFEHKSGILFVNDSYNAAEESLKAALSILPKPLRKGRKIAVIGAIAELGAFSAACHANVGLFALPLVDAVYCLGEDCYPIVEIWEKANRPVKAFTHLDELTACLKLDLREDDVVLLKGSRVRELWKILEAF